MSVRGPLAGGRAPPSAPFSVCYVRVCVSLCAYVRGYYALTAEAKCLNAARASRLYCSPYLLITSDSLLPPSSFFFFFSKALLMKLQT